MKKILLGSVATLFALQAHAADLARKAPVALPPVICTPGNCSGWYGGFGFTGNGSNADIVGSGLNGSVFAAGGAITALGGYQLWSGSWFAAIEARVGYEFTTATNLPVKGGSGSNRIVGQELIKIGYNFFPSAASSPTVPAQSPVPLLTPSNLLAASTPYLVGGGCQMGGRNVWCNGVGVETVIASGWSSSADYLYAPSQNNQPAISIVQLSLKKHF